MSRSLKKGPFVDAYLLKKVEALIEKRQEARKNKDFKLADEIRDKLKAMNIVLKDISK